jgi:hypothetical protein
VGKVNILAGTAGMVMAIPGNVALIDQRTQTQQKSGGRRRSPYASRGSGIAERLECVRVPALLFEGRKWPSSDDDLDREQEPGTICFFPSTHDTRHSDFIAKRESGVGHLAGKATPLYRPTNTNTTEKRRKTPHSIRFARIEHRGAFGVRPYPGAFCLNKGWGQSSDDVGKIRVN